MLLLSCHASCAIFCGDIRVHARTHEQDVGLIHKQETLNYWKQTSHVLKYFRAEEEPKARLPSNFINGFLEASVPSFTSEHARLTSISRVATKPVAKIETKNTKSRNVYIAVNTISFLCAIFHAILERR